MDLPPPTSDALRLRSGVFREDPSAGWEYCSGCGLPIDVSEVQPLTAMACPRCGKLFSALREFGPYMLHQLLGQGGMSYVYRAMDRELERFIALKVLRDEMTFTENESHRLTSEAATMALINDPHVVRIFSTGMEYGHLYIAMELLPGGTLQTRLTQTGPLEEAQALDTALQVAMGLQSVLKQGILHRDVKPANILYTEDGIAKIADFGLALPWEGTSEDADDSILGTADYLPPERIEHAPEDCRSDIYSLGATLYHAITGRPPFEAPSPMEVAMKRMATPPVRLQTFAPDITPATAFCIDRMLARLPEDRFQSYDELIDHLKYARHELGRRMGKIRVPPRVVLETVEDQRRSGLLALFVLGVCLLLGIAVLISKSQQTPPTNASSSPRSNKDEQVKWVVAAQQLLISGKNETAAKAFHVLSLDKKTAEPLLQWCIVQEGMSWLAAGHLKDAKVAFASLAEHPYTAATPDGDKLRAFFRAAAERMANDKVIPSTVAKEIDKSGPALMELLIYGLKNWELSAFDEAAALLRQFESAGPDARFSWIKDYRSLANDYVLDYAEYRGALSLLKNASTEGEYALAAKKIAGMKMKLNRSGKMVAVMDRLTADATRLSTGGGIEQMAPTTVGNAAFRMLNIHPLVSADSREGLFENPDATEDTLRFNQLGEVIANGIPFDLIDPNSSKNGKNLLILKGGKAHSLKYPRRVEISVPNLLMKRLYILGGVAGWGYPIDKTTRVVATVTLVHQDGTEEKTDLKNGVEIADYGNAGAEVPGSRTVQNFVVGDRQIRTISINVTNTQSPVEKIVIESPESSVQAPVFAAFTAELNETSP